MCWVKGKVALLQKQVAWDDSGLMSKDHLCSSGPSSRVVMGREKRGTYRELREKPVSSVTD